MYARIQALNSSKFSLFAANDTNVQNSSRHFSESPENSRIPEDIILSPFDPCFRLVLIVAESISTVPPTYTLNCRAAEEGNSRGVCYLIIFANFILRVTSTTRQINYPLKDRFCRQIDKCLAPKAMYDNKIDQRPLALLYVNNKSSGSSLGQSNDPISRDSQTTYSLELGKITPT